MKEKVNVTGVPETMVQTLYARAKETKKQNAKIKDEIAAEMAEIDQWLSEQKGFGFFSSISAKQRLMYAGMIAQQDYINDKMMQSAAVNGVISLIVAQQAAMCAAITASAAATANNNNS